MAHSLIVIVLMLRLKVTMHPPFFRIDGVIKFQFVFEDTEQLCLQPHIHILEIVLEISSSWGQFMGDGLRVVLEWNIEKLHESKHIILEHFEVQEKVIVHSTGEAELKNWLEVFVVEIERESGHEL